MFVMNNKPGKQMQGVPAVRTCITVITKQQPAVWHAEQGNDNQNTP